LTLYPFVELEAGSAFRVPTFRNYALVNPRVGSPRDLGMRHMVSELKVKLDPSS
jgi:hypothetical protein